MKDTINQTNGTMQTTHKHKHSFFLIVRQEMN